VTEVVDLTQALCRISHPESLFAIGLTSGLGSIAYSVVAVSSDPMVKRFEVMPGPRKKCNEPHRRYKAHRLMFEIIFDRWPPAVIGLGPPANAKEPLEWIAFMRAAVFEMCKPLQLPVVLFDTDQHLKQCLGAPSPRGGPSLKKLLQRELPSFRSDKQSMIRATASAIGGAVYIRNREEDR